MAIELSCQCGEENDFREITETIFEVDGEGNREDKLSEVTEYKCINCGRHAEIHEID